MPTPSVKKPEDRKASKGSTAKKAAATRKPSGSATSRRAEAVAAVHSVPVTASGADVVADPYAPTAWGQEAYIEDIICPSGQRALVRRPGVQGLIIAGALEEVDSLSAIVDQKHIKRVKGEEQVDSESLMNDPEQIAKVIGVADRIVQYIVVKPALALAPADDADRKPDVLYVDAVDLDDRLFLMNYAVGGTRSAEQFRDERSAVVGSMGDGVEVQLPPKRSVRSAR